METDDIIRTAEFELRWAAGKKKAYPVNDSALHFAGLLGMKTVPLNRMRHIEALGYIVDITDKTVPASG